MKSNNKKYSTTVGMIWLGCAILLFFFYMIVLQPQMQRKKNATNLRIEQEQAYNAAVEANEEQTQARLIAQVTELQGKLKSFVVDFADSANLTFDISEAASRKQIQGFSIKSQGNRNTSDMSEFANIDENYFDVTFTAGFNQFATFLSALERHEPTMLVDEFVITRSDESDLAHHTKLNLAVLVTKK